MRITKREKVLLALLIFALLFYAGYRFLVIDQLTEIDVATSELAYLQQEIIRLERIEEERSNLELEIASVQEQQSNIKNDFFSLIDEQEEIILLLNEFLLNPNVDATSVAFTTPGTETVEEVELYFMDVTLSYQSDYPALLRLFRSVWNFERKLILHQVNMNTSDEQEISGNFQMRFYDLSQITGELDRLFSWLQVMESIKNDPFSGMGDGININERYDMLAPVEREEPIEAEPEEFTEPEEITEEEIEEEVEEEPEDDIPEVVTPPVAIEEPEPEAPPVEVSPPEADQIIDLIRSLEVLNATSQSPTIIAPITTGDDSFMFVSTSAGPGAAVNIAFNGSSATVVRNVEPNQNRNGSITIRVSANDGSTATKTFTVLIPNGYSEPYNAVTVFE